MQAPKLQRRLGRQSHGPAGYGRSRLSAAAHHFLITPCGTGISSYHRWLMHRRKSCPAPGHSRMQLALHTVRPCMLFPPCVGLQWLACREQDTQRHLMATWAHRNVPDLFTERRKVSHHPPLASQPVCAAFAYSSSFACPMMKASFRSCDDRLL